MLNRYVDRGIIKWGSFDALVGYSSMIEELKYKLGKKEKPSLSEDALEMMNRSLQDALKNDKEIELRYFQDGYTRHTYGKVFKIDYQNKLIVLSTREKFYADEILEIILI